MVFVHGCLKIVFSILILSVAIECSEYLVQIVLFSRNIVVFTTSYISLSILTENVSTSKVVP